MALGIVINLIYTPAMIGILGNAEYGIYSLVSSIIQYLNLFSLGFSASYIRFYSKYSRNNDEESIKRLNGLYMLFYLCMGFLGFLCGTFLSANANVLFNASYTSKDIELAKILLFFLAINFFETFVGSVFVSYISSQEKFIFQKIVNIGKTVLSPALSIVFLLLGFGSIGMVIVTTCVSFLIDVANAVYCFWKLNFRISFKRTESGLLKQIFIFSLFIAINDVIDQINWQTDKIILGKMVNATAVAIYTVGANINTMYINFSTAISSVFAPKIHKIENSNELTEVDKNKKLNELFVKVGRIQMIIILLILTGFIFFGQSFITLWVGEAYSESYFIVLLLICPATISLCQNIGIEIQRAKNLHKFRSIVYLIMAVLNVGISILLCYFVGTIGTAIGTCISLIFANGLLMNIYYYKKVGLNVLNFRIQISKLLIGLIPPAIVGCLIALYAPLQNWINLILFIILYAFTYCISLFFLSFNKYEKSLVITPARKIYVKIISIFKK